ncbi:DUF2142 domain-containing protein [Methanobrevibacter boviskoreani]|uniref:DUF2142 domain-containing protein n=1 Tax=Methanobrevibacter boviskoreani TaxID=1348249 RepID=UPI0023A8DB6C|nr:DUF2142 domain-containing protein [Methanobrevibacter boviskoreani]MCI6775471.1 DUF2142 domain-containing protein [Methanobrevibacter boviskoreani]
MYKIKSSIKCIKEDIINLKYFFFIYALCLILFIYNNNLGLKTVLLEFLFFTILTCVLLLVITKKDMPIHKVAFLIIIIFGICTLFVSPIFEGPDEFEHLVRAEMTSKGELIPQYIDNPNNNKTHKDYLSIRSIYLISQKDSYRGVLIHKTVFQTPWDTQKIDYTPTFVYCAFAQNPFYGYIAPAIGIIIAKALNLNNMWLFWLGRLFTLLSYGLISSYAIKKAPIYKEALFATACFPLLIMQGSVITIDALVNSSMLLVIAYFLYMYEFKDHTITWKQITTFGIIVLICTLTKVPFIFLSLLIFLIPRRKFKNRNTNIFKTVSFLITGLITWLWLKLYSNKVIANSTNRRYYLANEATHKSYILHHFTSYLQALFDPSLYSYLIKDIFFFSNPGYFHKTTMIFALILFILFCLEYPQEKKIKKSGRVGLFIIGLLILFSTITTLYLSYTKRFDIILGVQGRYLTPLLVFAPIIFNINKPHKPRNKTKILFYTMVIFFCTTLVLSIISQFYILHHLFPSMKILI